MAQSSKVECKVAEDLAQLHMRDLQNFNDEKLLIKHTYHSGFFGDRAKFSRVRARLRLDSDESSDKDEHYKYPLSDSDSEWDPPILYSAKDPDARGQPTNRVAGIPTHPESLDAKFKAKGYFPGPTGTKVSISRLEMPILFDCMFVLPNYESRMALLHSGIEDYVTAEATDELKFVRPWSLKMKFEIRRFGAPAAWTTTGIRMWAQMFNRSFHDLLTYAAQEGYLEAD